MVFLMSFKGVRGKSNPETMGFTIMTLQVMAKIWKKEVRTPWILQCPFFLDNTSSGKNVRQPFGGSSAQQIKQMNFEV